MSISYSKSFVTFEGSRNIIPNGNPPGRANLGFQLPSTMDDAFDPNLRHQMASEKVSAAQAGMFCFYPRSAVNHRANALVIVGSSILAYDDLEFYGPGNARIAQFTTPLHAGTNVLVNPLTLDNFRELWWCVTLAENAVWSLRFCGVCEMTRIPRDPNTVKTEHLRLGIRSEFPGQQFHQEGLGTYRRITMTWERLGADDLAALDEAYHTVPTLEAPVVLFDDTDPQGAAYGRFIGFDWQSGAFDLTFDASMVFEEIAIPR